jgi:threonine dehydrogenase-like Zn-dependent dehydrogenase
MPSLPESHRALVLSSLGSPLEVKSVPMPTLLPGSASVQILSTPILAYAAALYSGALNYPLHPPQTIGGGAIGRIVALAHDATTLQPGQLVLLDPMVRGRDDPAQSILLGVHGGTSPQAARLMHGEDTWRDGSCAEYARWPLENVHALDEDVLCGGSSGSSTATSTSPGSSGKGIMSLGGLGYTIPELAYLLRLLVPMGGLTAALDVRAGDTVVIAPATGQFGGAAVEVALAMGADVVLCGRRLEALERMKTLLQPVYPEGRIEVVQLTGHVDGDEAAIRAACGRRTGAGVDAYIDFSPAGAAASTHIASCIMALRSGGKACFMGGITQGVQIPYAAVMFRDLTIRGKFMYEREGVKRLIGLLESGRLKLKSKSKSEFGSPVEPVKTFKLEEWELGFREAEQRSGWREMVVFEPAMEGESG